MLLGKTLSPALQLVQAGEQRTANGSNLLTSLPVLQLGAELRGHQVVYFFDHHIHLGQDFLVWARKKRRTPQLLRSRDDPFVAFFFACCNKMCQSFRAAAQIQTFLLKSRLLSISCSLKTSCFITSEFLSVKSVKHTRTYQPKSAYS